MAALQWARVALLVRLAAVDLGCTVQPFQDLIAVSSKLLCLYQRLQSRILVERQMIVLKLQR